MTLVERSSRESAKYTPMRTPFLVTACLGASGLFAQTTHIITATDFQFTPDLLTITAGDTIRLHLGPDHAFREVAALTWELNGSQPAIGWDIGPFTEFNDESYFVETTAPDTLYYVCPPHVAMGMKGRIIIEEAPIGIGTLRTKASVLFPNPTDGITWLSPLPLGAVQARLIDASGRTHFVPIPPEGRLDLGAFAPGLYQLSVLNTFGDELDRRSIALTQ